MLNECSQNEIDDINWPKYVSNILNNDNWLSTEVFKMKQPVLTEYVLQNVKKRAPELNNKFTEGAVQCLLWIKSEEAPKYKDLYESWKHYFLNYIILSKYNLLISSTVPYYAILC